MVIPVFLFMMVLLVISSCVTSILNQKKYRTNKQTPTILQNKVLYDMIYEVAEPFCEKYQAISIGVIFYKPYYVQTLQLTNALKDNMSIIGPRLLLVKYFSLTNYFREWGVHMSSRIPGWLQRNRTNLLACIETLKMDVLYVDNFSLNKDMQSKRVVKRFAFQGIIIGLTGILENGEN